MERRVSAAPAVGISIPAAELQDLSYPSPEFRAWVWEAYDSGRLELLLQAVLLAGQADSVVGAIDYLGRLWIQNFNPASRITVADLERRAPRYHLLSRLMTLVRGQTGRGQDPHLFYGLVSHQAVFDLLTGRLAGPTGVAAPSSSSEGQLDLWPTTGLPEESVSPHGQIEFGLGLASTMKVAAPSYAQRVQSMHRIWRRAGREAGPVVTLHPNLRPQTISQLREATHCLFPQYMQRLMTDRRDPTYRWRLLSYLSWGAAVDVVRHHAQPRILFREVPVIDGRHNIGGGRLDAIEVTAINGHRPRPTERRVLAGLAAERYASSGALINRLRQTFRGSLQLTIIDWKFLVGDVLESERQQTVPDLRPGPLPNHLRQMRRYLTLVPFDAYLHNRQGHLWETADVEINGEIWYLLPTAPMIVHQLQMSPAERQAAFSENVALSWPATQRRATLRQMNNVVLSHLAETLSGQKRKGNGNGHRNGHDRGPLTLFPEFTAPTTAHELIEAHRREHPLCVDRHGIIEVVGQRRNGHQYALHFDKLLAAIHRGDVPVPRRFNPERGGHVACVFPDHDDSTASFYLRLDRQRFFCFGCERGGEILPQSIPEGYGAELEVQLEELRAGPKAVAKRRQRGLAPDEHHRVMSVAQELLALSLRGSSGENYLTKTRGLDLELAAANGAGFGTDRLINGLIELGLGIDELRYYGFIGFSDAISTRGGIVPLLRRHGFKDEHMVRPTSWSTRKQEVLGMPYSVLQSRVTFPLELFGRLNNFYGRSVNPTNRLPHRKLSVDATKVLHGGYRLGLLTAESRPAEIIVAEGAIDALSLMTLGYPAAVAMIGVANQAILEALASFTGNLAIAFDIDSNQFKTGQTKTGKLEASLRAAGFRGQIRNFTADFLAARPGPFKDFNGYLVDSLRIAPQP